MWRYTPTSKASLVLSQVGERLRSQLTGFKVNNQL